MTDIAPRFRRTPALLKWLLNERAMVAGELHRRQGQIEALMAEVASYSEKLAALDTAIAIADSRVNASTLGCIRAHHKKYGGRGELTKFILAEVCAAGADGISTEGIAQLAATRFSVLLFRTEERKNYRETVRTRLRGLQDKGEIESTPRIIPSRTRNQTTLNNLANMLAGLNGEYSFCTDLLNAGELEGADLVRLRMHLAGLEAKREALRLTLLQFDPKIDVGAIRGTDTWKSRLGCKGLSRASLLTRLLG